MRVVAALAAILLLAGCEAQPGQPGDKLGSSEAAREFSNTGSGFDYRYAFRLPGEKLKEVQQSNAEACEKLGPARCSIVRSRYVVDTGNHIRAVLTMMIDPGTARTFGDAAIKTVKSADGVLVDSETAGADATSASRSVAVVGHLRDQLKASQAQAATSNEAKARADRIQSALDTIAEIEASEGQTLATAPVLITYESSTALTGLGSADANFRNAGQSLENSVSRVLTVLATVGPWLLALILIIIVLRLLVHGTGGGRAPEPEVDEDHHDESRHDHRNLIQRWFARDDDNGHDHESQPG